MTLIISVLLFSVSANIDNLIIFTSFNFQGKKLSFYHFFIISIISSTITFITMKYAQILVEIINLNISNILGALFLIILGIILIITFFIKKPISQTINPQLTVKFTFSLALALSINNIPTAISASLIGLPTLLSTITIFVNSMLFLYLGQLMTLKNINSFLGRYAAVIGGILLIILGFFQIVF